MAAKVIAGILFPFKNQGRGLPGQAFGVDVIRSSLIVLLKTRKRTRVMRPEIGLQLHRLLFEDQGDILQSLVLREIATGIATQLPMVQIRDIKFRVNSQISEKVLEVNVLYSIQGILDETGFVNLTTT